MQWNSICFDLDNTLFSHEAAFKRAMEDCFHTLIKPAPGCDHVTFKDFFPVFKRNSDRFWDLFEKKKVSGTEYRRMRFTKTMDELSLRLGNREADRFHERYYRIVDEFTEPFPGIESLFDMLGRKGVRLGIITNGTTDTQYRKLEKLNISRWVTPEQMIVSEEAGVAKPHPEIFRLAEETFSLKEPVLFVGDSWKHDVAGPIDAGWDSLFLNTRREDRKTDHKPAAECFTIQEVHDFLQSRLSGGGS
ncbi:HAD family hydrolase [Alteribacter natronophilus]|uniref:HAD family hydrolase n=1 Tax=Alteribacter natronophilus TaxID=2583810 RepID=UPI001485C9E2|nr:HAD-IA family hydrolase [Alteribacter natronophilus]